MIIKNEYGKSDLKKILSKVQKEADKYKDIEIYVKTSGKYSYLYCADLPDQNGKRHEKIVPLQTQKAHKLLKIYYYRKLKAVLEKEISAIEEFDEKYNPNEKYDVYRRIPQKLRSQITPLFVDPSDAALSWESESFEHNSYPMDEKQCYLTDKGERVRSKAEYIIANMLHSMGLSYRYECAYYGSARVRYPDFTVMHPLSGELYYIEYFGMIDFDEYSADAVRKISEYQHGQDAARFIYIFESSSAPMNTETIRNLFQHYFFTGQ